MSNDNTEFTPEQVERQIDLLAQDRGGRSDASSDARLISDLYQVLPKNHATIERAWQRLSTQVESTRPLTAVASQRSWQQNVLPKQREGPQGVEIKTTNKRPPRRMTRFLEVFAAILVVVALVAGTTFVLNNAHQVRTTSTVANSSGLYVNTRDSVSRKDLASGKVLWNYSTSQKEPVVSQIYVMDNVAIFQIASSSGDLVGVDTATGKQLWTQTSMQPSLLETVSDGVVIVFTYYVRDRTEEVWVSMITAYQVTTGQQLWSYKPAPPSNPQSVSTVESQFALANGVLYLNSAVERVPTFSPSTSQLVALQLSSGTPIWQKTMDGFPSLIADGNRLYFVAGKMINGVQRYECFALNSANGNQIWQTGLIGDAGDVGVIGFNPTVADGVLYIGSPDHSLATDAYSPHIYAYNANNGALLKKYTLSSQDGFNFPPLVVQNLLLYDQSAGNGPGVYYVNLVALDIKTGKLAWSVYAGPTSTLEPQIVNDIIYTPGGNRLLAYSTSGKLLHSYQTQTSYDASWNFTVVA
jgi:outer membrane protein assembly factor BamB